VKRKKKFNGGATNEEYRKGNAPKISEEWKENWTGEREGTWRRVSRQFYLEVHALRGKDDNLCQPLDQTEFIGGLFGEL